MPKKSKSTEMIAMTGIGASVVVCATWTLLTGALWPWIPVVGSAAMIIATVKAINSEGR